MKDLTRERTKAEMYFSLTPEERLVRNFPTTDRNIAKFLKVTSVTVCNWRKAWGAKNKKNKPQSYSDLSHEEKIEQFDNLLYELANDPKSPSKYKELFARRHGLLVDKTEQKVTHEIDGGTLAREIIKARRELENSGMAQVQSESRVLCEDLRITTGQGEDKDNQV